MAVWRLSGSVESQKLRGLRVQRHGRLQELRLGDRAVRWPGIQYDQPTATLSIEADAGHPDELSSGASLHSADGVEAAPAPVNDRTRPCTKIGAPERHLSGTRVE